MKENQRQLSELKNKLRLLKEKGRKSVCWKLNKQQVEYLQQLGYQIIPELYSIRTRKFSDVKNLKSILKDIHYSNVKGKREIVRKLKISEENILKQYEVKYRPMKYRIFL